MTCGHSIPQALLGSTSLRTTLPATVSGNKGSVEKNVQATSLAERFRASTTSHHVSAFNTAVALQGQCPNA